MPGHGPRPDPNAFQKRLLRKGQPFFYARDS